MLRSSLAILGLCLAASIAVYLLTDRPQPSAARFATGAAADTPGGALVVGAISTEPKDESGRLQILADYLARHLEGHGIRRGGVAVAANFEQMAELVRDGKVDLLVDSPFPIARLGELTGTRPILRRWKKSSADYRSYLVVLADSEIKSLGDLNGKMSAFEDPVSTFGYLLPKAALMAAGLNLVQYADPTAAVGADHVGYVFTRSDDTTLFWVRRGRAAIGATSDQDFREQLGDREAELRVIHETVSVPRQLVAHRPGLDPTLLAALTDVMVKMDADAEGRQVLEAFQKTSKFDALPPEAEASLALIAEYATLIGVGAP